LRFAAIACACLLACLALATPALATAKSPVEKMTAKINASRARHGLPPLRRSPSLTRSSRRFARWMMAHDFFGHRALVSADHHRFHNLGEAIAMHTGRKLGIGMTIRSWLRSPPHRTLVLTRSMRWLGAGVSRGNFGGRRRTIWVLQVGRR
jgi:uncharacterized protein YkwD